MSKSNDGPDTSRSIPEVPPTPVVSPVNDREKANPSPIRQGEREPEDPLLPPEPGHDINP